MEHKDAHRQYNKAIKHSKKHHWRDWLEKVLEPDLWTANKYIAAPASNGGKTRIPTLRQQANGREKMASSNLDKSKMLANNFFPSKPPETDNAYKQNHYPTPICKAHWISREQIKRQLKHLKPYKAPGPDRIPNVILTQCADIITDRLWYIYNAILEKEIYYTPWKTFTTVVLRNLGKLCYNTPKAYRPIALLNTLGKLLTAAIVEQLTYYTEKHGLLPPTHFRGRPGRTTTEALHMLTYKIKDTWHKQQVAVVLFLDIEGAFPNAVNERLEHNLKTRKVPKKLVKFISNLLKEWYTTLKFDNYVSDKIALDNGIGQGDPLSMVLYQYYNTDLLGISTNTNESVAAHVDDAILIATGKDFAETHETSVVMMSRAGGVVEWSKNHNSKFKFSKLALIDFAHQNCKKHHMNLMLPNTTIKPAHSTKYLGIYVDQHLDWSTQVAYAIKKGAKWNSQIRQVTAPSWGLTPQHTHKMFNSVAIPRILYAVDIWGIPKPIEGTAVNKRNTSTVVSKLASTQRAGALVVTGGLWTTPTDILDMHAHLMPMHLERDKICHRAATRIVTLPPAHPLYKPARNCTKRRTSRHKSPLHQLMLNYATKPQDMETIKPTPQNPALTHTQGHSQSTSQKAKTSQWKKTNEQQKRPKCTQTAWHRRER